MSCQTCKTRPVRKIGGRPAPSRCIICQDYLLQFDDAKGSETPALLPIVTARCGHLFHTVCLNGWFATMKRQELKNCPYCKKEMRANDTKRIFPVSGEE